jgi:hypothetical protein
MNDAAKADSAAATTDTATRNRRRRICVSLALSLTAAGCVAWWMTHRSDSRLVGTWLFTRGTPPTVDELRSEKFQIDVRIRIEWSFAADGTGRQVAYYGMPSIDQSEFTWWTRDGAASVMMSPTTR